MRKVSLKGNTLKQPNSVVKATIEKETYPAMLPSDDTPDNMKVTDLFKKGTEPDEVSPRYTKLNNVSGASATLSGNKITLSWKPIATPDNIDKDKVHTFLKELYKNDGYLTNAVNKQLSYFGNVSYKIYEKTSAGNNLVTETSDTTVTIPVSNSSTGTYIIKSAYSNYNGLTSDGVSVTIDVSGIPIVPDPDPEPIDPNIPVQ